MKNKITEANVSMVISKTFSGLNMNALKYLLPLWMTPLSGVTIRCIFAAGMGDQAAPDPAGSAEKADAGSGRGGRLAG